MSNTVYVFGTGDLTQHRSGGAVGGVPIVRPEVLTTLGLDVGGRRGQHTRAAVGVASLSQDAPVENEITVQAKD